MWKRTEENVFFISENDFSLLSFVFLARDLYIDNKINDAFYSISSAGQPEDHDDENVSSTP